MRARQALGGEHGQRRERGEQQQGQTRPADPDLPQENRRGTPDAERAREPTRPLAVGLRRLRGRRLPRRRGGAQVAGAQRRREPLCARREGPARARRSPCADGLPRGYLVRERAALATDALRRRARGRGRGAGAGGEEAGGIRGGEGSRNGSRGAWSAPADPLERVLERVPQLI